MDRAGSKEEEMRLKIATVFVIYVLSRPALWWLRLLGAVARWSGAADHFKEVI
jgi:hypothetical protein